MGLTLPGDSLMGNVCRARGSGLRARGEEWALLRGGVALQNLAGHLPGDSER